MIHLKATFEADCAPAMSPWANLVLTFAAYTMDTMPPIRQQNSVERMAPTMWLGTLTAFPGAVFVPATGTPHLGHAATLSLISAPHFWQNILLFLRPWT